MTRVRLLTAKVLDRSDLIVIVALLLATQLLRVRPPLGIGARGLVQGAYLALQAVGLVLVYRANRIVNFAQVAVGVVAAAVFDTLVRYQSVFHGVHALCPPCIPHVTRLERDVNYVGAFLASLALSIFLSWLTYALIIRRFSNAPRLVLTVATIFLAQLYTAMALGAPLLLATKHQRKDLTVLSAGIKPPLNISLHIAPVTLQTADILMLLVAAVAVVFLAVYLRRSPTGVAIRAAAENAPRAQTLGVNVSAVTSRVWLAAGALSASAALLAAVAGNARTAATSLSAAFLLRMLAVGVIARFTSLPIVAAAAVAVGVFETSVLYAYQRVTILDAVLAGVVFVTLALQRQRASRAEVEAGSAWKASREVRPIPRELRHLPAVRSVTRWTPALVAVAALGYPWAMDAGQTSTASRFMILGIVALSLLVLTGWGGQISLGQSGFMALGGFVVGALHPPFLIALLVSGLIGALAATLVGLPALRLRGLELAVVTLAASLAGSQLLMNPEYLGRHLRANIHRPVVLGIDLADARSFYYLCLVVMALVVVAVIGMRRSRTARALIAARDNALAAQSYGINLLALRLGAFAASGAMAGLAGALLAYQDNFANAQNFAGSLGISYFIMAVVGGLGSVVSPLIGALYFGLLTTLSSNPIVIAFGTGGAGVLLMIVMPGGLGLLLFDLRDAWLRRLARRHRIVVPSLVADVYVDGREVAPIAPHTRPGGGEVFVPRRYSLDDQWAVAPATVPERVRA
jgi:branched-chain amino acid transport system permease protein